MLWGTVWALIFGFALSGIVQAFVSRRHMHALLGDHRPATIVRAGVFGMVSSSCSYAATALAKSLFQRGADFTAAMVFMVASTNLVVELGIVLWLLLGWQFALAEFVGGVIMIMLFALVAPRVFPRARLERARLRLEQRSSATSDPDEAERGPGFGARVRSVRGWADAAGYAVSDFMMLRRELLIGYLVAGVLAVAVPPSVYGVVFLHGGAWAAIENAVAGPFVAFISFVCSIGNVPLAAALFHGGLSFGGTVAFVFADLIALPLVMIYSKFYGRRIALRLLLTFWPVMSATGLIVDLLFRFVGIPLPQPARLIGTASVGWNITTGLNVAFLIVAVAAYMLFRRRSRFATGTDPYARDVVCGMQVERVNAPACHARRGTTYFFCSDRCHDRFVAMPQKYLSPTEADTMPSHDASDSDHGDAVSPDLATDPVCGMEVDRAQPAATHVHAGTTYYFCAMGCYDRFVAHPDVFAAAGSETR